MSGRHAWSAIAVVGFIGACTPVKTGSKASSEAASAGVGAGAGATAASASASNSDTPAGSTGSVADAGAAGSTPAGSGGAAGSGVAGSSTPPGSSAGARAAPSSSTQLGGPVRGKVIDFYRQPVSGVQVTVANETFTTDADGVFMAPAVESQYDATLLVTTSDIGAPRYVWRFEGLTRRDPTLQVDVAGEIRSGAIELNISGVAFQSLTPGETILTSFGSLSGEYETTFSISAMLRDRVSWRGPSAAHFTLYALRFIDAGNAGQPTEYVAYDSESFDLAADGTAQLGLDLTRGTLPLTRTVRGTLQSPVQTQPRVEVYLRFPDNAAIPIIVDRSGDTSFDYVLPEVPAATFTAVAVLEIGDSVRIAHIDSAEGAPIELRLPTVATLDEPAPEEAATAQTSFKWSGDAGVYVFRARSFDRNDVLQLVTSRHEAKLPTAPHYAVPSKRQFAWWVETHGAYASVDEAAGPEGFLDTCAARKPTGPERGRGTYSESLSRNFTTP